MRLLPLSYGFRFLVPSPKDGELLGLEWGMIPQVSNIVFPDENSHLMQKRLEILRILSLTTRSVG